MATPAKPDWASDAALAERLKTPLAQLCAHYLVREKRNGLPLDSVARFHLGNGARLERINWLGDISEKGAAESACLLVNYKYDLAQIEKNHEAFANAGVIAHSTQVEKLLKDAPFSFRQPEP